MMGEFRAVYLFEKESLIEISNKTIFALIHHCKVDDEKKIKMDIYIKSRGFFSRLYMAIIRPFRHLLVYPAWFKMIRIQWLQRQNTGNHPT